MKVFITGLLGLLLSAQAHASDYSRQVEVYRIVSVGSEDSAGWTSLVTTSGLAVFTRCSHAQFDDPTHDRVGAFKSAKECLALIAHLKAAASFEHPVGLQIGPDFVILTHKEM